MEEHKDNSQCEHQRDNTGNHVKVAILKQERESIITTLFLQPQSQFGSPAQLSYPESDPTLHEEDVSRHSSFGEMSISKAFVAAGVGSMVQGFRDQGIKFNRLHNLMPKLSVAASAFLALQTPSFSSFQMKKSEAENNGSRKLREEESLRRVMYLACWSPS
ncbi:hypothetical protein KI387_023586 [Taxus chinensis]|uniref:Uncharacterized protein n=1 Tax=Taxus chinensis TaxID=29808 RepID=A0AA38L7K7_TAXCH|nr:hypothetical protein KI387_023586 [Taxus chinensis]